MMTIHDVDGDGNGHDGPIWLLVGGEMAILLKRERLGQELPGALKW